MTGQTLTVLPYLTLCDLPEKLLVTGAVACMK